MARVLDNMFLISKRRTTVGAELMAGVTHFLGAVWNLSATASVMEVAGLPHTDGVVAGAWAACISGMLCGLFSNLPINVNAGAGPNFSVAYNLALPLHAGGLGGLGAALTCCLASGLGISLLALSGTLSRLADLVPGSLKMAICVGIGLICAFVGMQQVGMVVACESSLLCAGDYMGNHEIWLTAAGLLLLTVLNARQVKASALFSMAAVTLVDWCFFSGWPDLELIPPRLPKLHWPRLEWMASSAFWVQVSAMVMMLVFDTLGCMFGMARLAGLLNKETGTVEGGNGLFCAVGFGTAASALVGLSPIVINPQSSAAIVEGAKTGLSSCTSAMLFLIIGLPFANIFAVMPKSATSSVLLYAGCSFAAEAAGIDWEDPIAAIPAFLCIICQPFLFSIANGIYVGLASSLLLNVLTGRSYGLQRFLGPAAESSLVQTLIPASPQTPHSQHSRCSTSSSMEMPGSPNSRPLRRSSYSGPRLEVPSSC